MSVPDDVDFFWENDQMVSLFQPGIETPFSLLVFSYFEMGAMAENPVLIDQEQDKENSAPTTPVSERPAQPHLFMRRRPFGIKYDNVTDYFYKKL